MSAQQLCQSLGEAELRTQGRKLLGKHTVPVGMRKRKRSKTPEEEIASGDEARFLKQEQKAAKRAAIDDLDYETTSTESGSSG